METEEARRQRMGQVARFAYKRAREEDGRGPEDIQYLDDELRITVRSSYSRRNDIFTTEVLVYIRADKTGSHHHLVIDENGRVIFDEWRVRNNGH